jgi:ribulose kinase
MNADSARMFGMTLEETNAALKALGHPPLTGGALAAMVASGLIHTSPETRRAMEQQRQMACLTQKQQTRVHSYMREGLTFEQAYDAALRTDPVKQASQAPVRLASINLPAPNAPRGRKLTRRQRRKG